jgi:1,4-alpha-glucan branching enzyme
LTEPGRERGELAIVLHSHMPYVEGFDTWPFGEEWLWEAVAGVYLPMLHALREAPVTLGLTPVLCDQLEALQGEAGERFLEFLRGVRAEIHAEDASGLDRTGYGDLAAEVRRAAGDYSTAAHTFERIGGDVLGELRELWARGVELWTGAATHAVLPMVATDAGLRLQVAGGVASHEHRFETWTGGFWLPECAYRRGLERDLIEHGVRCFCVDQTDALGLGSLDQLEPIATAAGPVAVPVDWELVRHVWDGTDGYPANPAYRDYHGRTVHDLKPWNIGGRPYRHYEALKLARSHARDFVKKAIARLDAYREERGRPGLSCFALDTELLGHWWYEGVTWLQAVTAECERQGVELVHLDDALARHEPVPEPAGGLPVTTWGRPRDLATWSGPRVADLAWELRTAELEAVAASPGVGTEAVRELLAAQASDWAFVISEGLAESYGRERHRAHLDRFRAALRGIPSPAAARNLAPYATPAPLESP